MSDLIARLRRAAKSDTVLSDSIADAITEAADRLQSLSDQNRLTGGWRDMVTDAVHRVAKRTSEEGYSVAIMREGIDTIAPLPLPGGEEKEEGGASRETLQASEGGRGNPTLAITNEVQS